MKKFITLAFLLIGFYPGYCQQFMSVVPDSGYKESFTDFIGVKLIASDLGLNSLNQNLNFKYMSQNTGFILSHSMDIKGLNNMPNLGFGIEEGIDGHLLLKFVEAGIGYIQQTLEWNAGIGVGYYLDLNKKKNLSLRAHVNLNYENISHTLGTYTDTTLQGFVIDGLNIGTYVKNVKYVNNLLCVSPDIELVYKREKWDYFIGIGYNYTLLSKEKISFYRTQIHLNEALYNSTGAINSGVIMPSYYIFKIGMIKEFGL